MPTMHSNVGLAFGTLAGELGKAYATKKQREYDAQRNDTQMMTQLVSSGLQSGTIENPEEAFQWMLGQMGGGGKGKGGKKGELPPQLRSVIKATMQAGGGGAGTKTAGGQERGTPMAGQPPQAAQGGAGGLPPVPGTPAGQPGQPRFRSGAQDVQQRRQEEIDRAWTTAKPYEDPKTKKWVLQNPITGETRPAPGVPESVAKGGTLGSVPGTVSGKDAISSFPQDFEGNPTDPEKTYRYIKQGNEIAGIIPTNKTGAAGQQDPAQLRERYELIAGKQGKRYEDLKPEEQATIRKQASEQLLKEAGTKAQGVNIRVEAAREAAHPDPVPDPTGERPDPATANKVDQKTGLTGNAVYQDALTFAMENRLPSMGLGAPTQIRNARFAIQNKAAAIAAAAGVDLPTVRAEYSANKKALDKIVPFYNMTAAFMTMATRNMNLALNQSAKVPRTGSPIVNRYSQWAFGKELTGNAELTKFETYIYTAAREYAKVTGGAAMSSQGLTDSANREAQQLLNAAQTPEAFEAAISAMKNDMESARQGYGSQVSQISDTVGRFLGAPPPSGTGGGAIGGGAGAPSPAGGRGGAPAAPAGPPIKVGGFSVVVHQ